MNSYSLLAREIALQCNWQIFLSSYQYQQIKSINKEMIIASSSETRFECLQTQIPMQSHLGCLLIALIRIFVYYIDSFRFDWSASKQCVMQFQIYFLIKSMLTHKDHQHWCGQIYNAKSMVANENNIECIISCFGIFPLSNTMV